MMYKKDTTVILYSGVVRVITKVKKDSYELDNRIDNWYDYEIDHEATAKLQLKEARERFIENGLHSISQNTDHLKTIMENNPDKYFEVVATSNTHWLIEVKDKIPIIS